MPPSKDDFTAALAQIFSEATAKSLTSVQVSAGELHRRTGEYPGPNHRMPGCCSAMRAAIRTGDMELPNDLKKDGASYAVRYKLPR